MPKSLMIVMTNPTSPEQRVEFEQWYDHTHLREVAALDGVVSATRYSIAGDIPIVPGLPTATQTSLALYELEAESEEAIQAMAARMTAAMGGGSMNMSPTLDLASAAGFFLLQASEKITG